MEKPSLAAMAVYTRPRIIAVAFLGFASGLPLPLVLGTLSAWMREVDVSRTAIGLFAAITTPYVLKFLWSPLIDQLRIPLLGRRLGRRRSWLVVTQACTAISIIMLGMSHPESNLAVTAFWALMVAIASASQDIVIDAYRVELLEEKEQGAGAASVVFGYNIGMRLVGGALALMLADLLPWATVYALMAVVLGVGTLTALVVGEPEGHEAREKRSWIEWFREAVIAPFAQFMSNRGWWLVLLFILFYKFGDAFAGIMTNPFLIDLGFSKTEIGVIGKTYGLFATLAGSFIGGALVCRLGTVGSLWVCGLLQMVSNLVFVAQAQIGYDPAFLTVTIGVENLSGGMGTAAFVAFISNLCHRSYTATQYALLSSVAAVGRTWLSASSGWFADELGWGFFFILSTVVAVPGLLLLLYISKYLGKRE